MIDTYQVYMIFIRQFRTGQTFFTKIIKGVFVCFVRKERADRKNHFTPKLPKKSSSSSCAPAAAGWLVVLREAGAPAEAGAL